MEGTSLLVLLLFVGLLLSGLWIPFAVGLAALVYLLQTGGAASLKSLGLVSWGSMNSFPLTAIPLFLLMAEILLESGLSRRVYRGLGVIVRRLPGGLLQTNVAGCAVFAAVSGSSVACAASIGTVSVPQLRALGYDMRIAAGTLAAGGTLGILIPPSIAMIVYGTFAETSISKLFLAGVVPGLVLTLLFMVYVGVRALVDPSIAPRGDPGADGRSGSVSVKDVVNDLMPFTTLIVALIGSLYAGVVTPTEAAALGCCLAFVVARIWGHMGFADLRRALRKTMVATGAILFVVYTAFLFSYAVAMAGVATDVAQWVRDAGVSKLGFVLFVVAALTLLGCFVDSIGMMVIAVPILLPSLATFGIDPVWFGVMVVMLVELGQITPPMGMNLFVIKGISGQTLGDVIRGTAPFYAIFFAVMLLLYLFPALALWLPAHL